MISLRKPRAPSAVRHQPSVTTRGILDGVAQVSTRLSSPRWNSLGIPFLGRVMRDFRGLRVWKASHELTLAIYAATKSFPSDERFGLRSQMRRAAAPIPTNIAEACGRRGDGDQIRFFHFAMGSACELEYQVQLSRDLGILPQNKWTELTTRVVDVKRMLTGLTRTAE